MVWFSIALNIFTLGVVIGVSLKLRRVDAEQQFLINWLTSKYTDPAVRFELDDNGKLVVKKGAKI